MKKFGLLLVMSLLVVGFSARQALAVAAFKNFFEEKYLESGDNKALKEVYDGQKSKCNVCHYGKSKKNRNDYGKALGELLDKDNYKSSRVKAEPDLVAKELKEAFEKVEKMKATGGETFGDLIKAGKLPGTAPEGEE